MSVLLEIQTLGGLSLRLDETAVSSFASRKAEALLLYLACNPRPHARETLATMFWDDSPQQRSLANLSVLLTSLRKQVAPFIKSSRHDIQIDTIENIWIDAIALSNALSDLPTQQALTRSTAVSIADAVSLYNGPFLAGFYIQQAAAFSEWALLEQERLAQMTIHGMDKLANFYLERGQYAEGISLGRTLISLDPMREESHRQLIKLFAASGQRHAAVEQYESCVAILDEELGLEPAEETIALIEQVRNGQLGEETAVIIQRHPTAKAKHNIPTEMTSFVGRERELTDIEIQLNQPMCRLLTVLGPGGVGKTRLAQAIGRQMADSYLDGVWFVPLASLSSADFLETAVADAIGFSFSGNQSPRDQLLNYLSQKELLLILDNFEHLIDSKAIQFITSLLTHAPELQLLISSRERLQLQAEWLFEVQGLPYPQTVINNGVEAYGAVQLFCQRTQQLSPSQKPAENDLPQVVEIVRLLAGMPLGIELAAANLRYYDWTDIIDGIRQGLDFLHTNLRDLPERHRSLRGVIDGSWRILSEAEQDAFMGLSVFQGDFSQKAALAVLQTTPDLLNALVDKSLLQRMKNGRFQLHNILRQYASEKLKANPNQQATYRQRHSAFYADLVATYQQGILGGNQQQALKSIQDEIENIRTSWAYARLLPTDSTTLLSALDDTIDVMFYFYYMRSWLQEGATIFGQIIDWLEGATNAQARFLLARLKARYGWLIYLAGERQEGKQLLEESLIFYRSQSDFGREVVFCLNYLGAMAYVSKQVEQVQRYLDEALTLANAIGDLHGEGIGLNILGGVLTDSGEFEKAAEFLQKSSNFKRQVGDYWGIAFSLASLARVEMALEKYESAAANLQESLSIRRTMGDQRGEALCLQQLAEVAQAQNEIETAVSLYTDALTIFKTIGDAQAVAQVEEKLAHLKDEG